MSEAASGAVVVPSPPVPHLPRLLHRRQIGSWDCGVACVYSVLIHLGEPTLLYGGLIAQVAPCEQRVWTIDLAFLLHAYGVGVHFRSARLGVDPAHADRHFYDHFDRDTTRVAKVFEEAKRLDMDMKESHLTSSDLLHLLRTGHFLLLLVDDRFLVCTCCDRLASSVSGNAPSATTTTTTEFTGHFILAYGVNSDDHIAFLDPSARHAPCTTSAEELDRARLSAGTDEDVVIIDIATADGSPARTPKIVHATAIGLEEERGTKQNAKESGRASVVAVPAGSVTGVRHSQRLATRRAPVATDATPA